MNSNLRNDINARHVLISSLINPVEKKLEKLPSGRLKICHHGNKTYYYFYEDRNSTPKLLNRNNTKLIADLAQRSYLERVLKVSKQEVSALDHALRAFPENVAEEIYDSLNAERRKLVKPITTPDEQFIKEWLEKPYAHKPIKEGQQVFYTSRGEIVRSKSEVIIADRLYANGIPYKYECPIKIGNITIHPDFTILRISDRKILYLEHNGMMGDPDYVEKMVSRVSLYNQAGIIQGDNLFLTFESEKTPFNIKSLDHMIENYFK